MGSLLLLGCRMIRERSRMAGMKGWPRMEIYYRDVVIMKKERDHG